MPHAPPPVYDSGARLQPDAIVDAWIMGPRHWPEEMRLVTQRGQAAVLSAPFYLNYIGYGSDWHAYYQIEPSNFTGGRAAEQGKLISGIKACLWSEYIDATNLIARAWPRAAAVAERAWSAADVSDLEDAQARLAALRCELIARGINAEPANGPGFCQREWVPAY